MCIPGGIKVISQKNFAWVLLYLKSNINVVFCVINTTILNTLLERFHYIKIARFTRLARITTTVLICILPRVAALVLVAMSGAIFTILPTANYIIMLPAVRYYRWKTVSSQQLQGILWREKKVAKDMFIISVVLAICVIQKILVVFFSQLFGNLYPSFFPWSTTLLLLNLSITVKPGHAYPPKCH